MTYLKVGWIHHSADQPVELYSELDSERWELRKIEVFADGRLGFADRDQSSRGTRLGEVKVPPLEEIASDPQFQPVEIAREEFEQAWARR